MTTAVIPGTMHQMRLSISVGTVPRVLSVVSKLRLRRENYAAAPAGAADRPAFITAQEAAVKEGMDLS